MLNFTLKTTLFFIILLGVLLGIWQASKITFDNSRWFADSHPQKKNKDYLNQEFEKGEAIIFVAKLKKSFFTPDIIESVKKSTAEIEKLSNVVEIKTPLNATIALSERDSLYVIPFQSALERSIIPDLANYQKKLVESSYYKRLISEDFKQIAFVVKINLDDVTNKFEIRQFVISQVLKILKKDVNLQNLALAGEGELNYKLDLQSRENLKLLLPLSFFIMLLLLAFIFRSFIYVFIVSITSFLCLLLSLSIFVLQNHPLNVIGLALPVLILVIVTADSIHIIARFNKLLLKEQLVSKVTLQAANQAIKQTYLPCLGTSLTTAIGFGSFYFSELIPLKNFGIDAMLAILLSYLVIIMATWSLLYIFQNRLAKQKPTNYYFLFKLANSCVWFSQKYKRIISWATIILIGALLFNLKNIFIETNFLDVFFPKKSEIYQNFLFVDKHLSGTGAIDILLKTKDDKNFRNFTEFEKIKNITAELKDLKRVTTIQSYLDPVNMIHKELKKDGTPLPDNDEELEQELLFLEFSRGDKQTDVISPHMIFDYSESRIHLQTPNLNSSKINILKNEVLAILKKYPQLQTILAGSSIFFHSLSEEVLKTQITSIIITLSITWLIFLFLFGFKLGTIGIIPSIFPVLVTSGLMIILKIPFDFAAIMIGSISFGLCVDDTIHLLHYFKRSQGTIPDRLLSSARTLCSPLAFTTVLFCLGFGVFLASDLVVLFRFGLFTFVTILSAFFATIIILPALISNFYKQDLKVA